MIFEEIFLTDFVDILENVDVLDYIGRQQITVHQQFETILIVLLILMILFNTVEYRTKRQQFETVFILTVLLNLWLNIILNPENATHIITTI